jgi:hypothetical protein
MGRLIATIYFLFMCILSGAQDSAFNQQVKTITGDFTDIAADNIGNMYVVAGKTQLKKITLNGDSVAVYNDVKRYGQITAVDVSNPFKILVHYAEAATIVILDRFLSVRTVIDLRRNNIQQAKAISLAYDNNIWVYDELDSKIKKIDDSGKILAASAELRNIFPEQPSFRNIFDDNKSLYLYDPNLGWYVFDHYGAFSKKYSFANWKDVQVINGTMVGRLDSLFVTASQGNLDYKIIKQPFPVTGMLKARFSNKHWYILYPGKIGIYDAL